jgi:hypothetical protein
MTRSANTLAQGRIIAEQRRGFYRIIQSWSTADLQASAIRYRMEAFAHPEAERFYMVRVRALRSLITKRAARKRRMRMAQ